MIELPFISVVIPNLDQAERLGQCLEALSKQTYPRDKYEVIVVDNGSTDNSCRIAEGYQVRLLKEEGQRNPYACRNAGIRIARGEIVALTDSKCRPHSDWLHEGARRMRETEAPIVGGRFECAFSDPPRVPERVYRLLYLWTDPAENDQRPAALTGNAFIRRDIFSKTGYYRQDVVAGADVEFIRQAYTLGVRVEYAPAAVVTYPAKNLRNLLRSARRDGRAARVLWAREKRTTHSRQALNHMRPLCFGTLQDIIARRGEPADNRFFFQIWLVIWLTKIEYGRGMLNC